MRSGRLTPAEQSTWTVEVRTCSGMPAAVCRTCGPVAYGAQARTEALRHLARHARHDVLPPHLRTCQCGRRGCPWHPRRRPCSGPIRLTLTCEMNSRTWRLTDTCSQCRSATPGAAAVPEPARSGPPAPGTESRPLRSDPGSDDTCPPNSVLHSSDPNGEPHDSRPQERTEHAQVWEATCPQCGLPPDTCWWTHSPADPASHADD